jgi:hypothetical protein
LQRRPKIGKRTGKLRETLSEALLRRWSSARGTILKRFTAVEQRPINLFYSALPLPLCTIA